jgi:glycosyltransferase involved in cell wall biosynthesis
MRLLFISRWFPYPANNGAKVRAFNLIEQLAQHNEVALVTFTDAQTMPEHIAHMRTICSDVRCAPYRPFHGERALNVKDTFGRWPRSIYDTYSHEIESHVRAMAAEHTLDGIVASNVDMALYPLALPKLPRVLEEVEISVLQLHMLNETHPLKRMRKMLSWRKWRRFTADMLKRYHGATTVSDPEAELIRSVAPGYRRLRIVANGADVKRLNGTFADPDPHTIAYAGALTYYVNFEAMRFFLGEVFPGIAAELPEVRLLMAGGHDGVPMHTLPVHPHATHVGHVSDIRPFVQGAWLSVVPENLGGGTRIKLLESMALGTPAVATAHSAKGLQVRDGHDILIANSPAELCNTVVRVMRDAPLRKQLSDNGKATILRKYDWRVIGKQLNEFVIESVRNAGPLQ